jgi:hypothetical protein
VSIVGYRKGGLHTKYDIGFDGIAEGQKRDAWEAKYGERAQELLDAKISRDQEELRKRRRASARFAVLPGLMASMKKGEEVMGAAMGKMLERKGTTPQRAYRAWSRRAAVEEAREIDFVVCESWCGGAYGTGAMTRHAYAYIYQASYQLPLFRATVARGHCERVDWPAGQELLRDGEAGGIHETSAQLQGHL